jgi:hypothetical protein
MSNQHHVKEKVPTAAELKLIYFDILRGYTEIDTDLGESYIKHLTVFDSIHTDTYYETALNKAKSDGLPTKKEQVKYLEQEDLWSEDKERQIDHLKSFILNLQDTKSKLFLEADVAHAKQQIEEHQEKYAKLLNEREQLLGLTAESYATKTSNEQYMQQILYKDKDLKENFFSEEEFNHLSNEELNKFFSHYQDRSGSLTIKNIKRISLLPFFTNFFYLCEDNPFIFYGKAVIELTFHQNELFAFGRYYKGIVQDSKAKAPSSIQDDPDALIEFYEGSKNAKEHMDKVTQGKGSSGTGASTIVGASKKDLEKLGYKQDGPRAGIDLMEEAEKRGGTMDMNDFIDIHAQSMSEEE